MGAVPFVWRRAEWHPCRRCNHPDSALPAGGSKETLHQACARAEGGIIFLLLVSIASVGADGVTDLAVLANLGFGLAVGKCQLAHRCWIVTISRIVLYSSTAPIV